MPKLIIVQNLKTLRRGPNRGREDEIVFLHKLLNSHLGPPGDQLPMVGPEASAFGPRTEAKVKKFQEVNKIDIGTKDFKDGVVGPYLEGAKRNVYDDWDYSGGPSADAEATDISSESSDSEAAARHFNSSSQIEATHHKGAIWCKLHVRRGRECRELDPDHRFSSQEKGWNNSGSARWPGNRRHPARAYRQNRHWHSGVDWHGGPAGIRTRFLLVDPGAGSAVEEPHGPSGFRTILQFD
jgi:hypothetical protein